jgi:hypothetical protein
MGKTQGENRFIMTETIPGTNVPMTVKKIKMIAVTPKKLMKWRKYFLLLTALFIVTAAIELYSTGASNKVIGEALLAVVMFIFSTKCETLYLKMKMESLLEAKLHD